MDFAAVLKRLPGRQEIVAAIERMPVAREAVSPFVAGETVGAAVAAVGQVVAAGMTASVAYLPAAGTGETALLAYMQTIEALDDDNLAEGSDLTVDLVALGLGAGSTPAVVSIDVAALCSAATAVGMTITFAGLSHDLVDDALWIRAQLAHKYPDLGVTIAANLLRSEGDCLDLARAGVRVRLIKREANEPVGVAFTKPNEVDKAYVRCMRILMETGATTIVATHDSRLIEIAASVAQRSERAQHYSFQFRRGVIAERAAELVASGSQVSILVPFGPDWASYMSRRIALKPSAVSQVARAAVGHGESAQ
ncbi:MAG: proline dehydrogenase family protein [Candidatus Nanopelagicales bacterium]